MTLNLHALQTDFHPSPMRVSAFSQWTRFTLFCIAAAFVTWAFLLALESRYTSPDDQIASALGCRVMDELLILKLQPDGRIAWPDAKILDVSESVTRLPIWNKAHDQNIALAVLADPDALLVQVTPLLDAATQLGLRRAILATPQAHNLD